MGTVSTPLIPADAKSTLLCLPRHSRMQAPRHWHQGQAELLGPPMITPSSPCGAFVLIHRAQALLGARLLQPEDSRAGQGCSNHAPALFDTLLWGHASQLVCFLRGKKCVIYGTFIINAHFVCFLIPNYTPLECSNAELCSSLQGQSTTGAATPALPDRCHG